MTESERLKLVELISGRLCLSLIGPVGAVANGLETLKMVPEQERAAAAQSMLDRECARMIDRLMFFRLAYGCDEEVEPLRILELRAMADSYFGGTHIELDWPELPGQANATIDRTAARVLLNGLLVVGECLGMRGRVSVRQTSPQDNEMEEIQVVGTGDLIPLSAAKCRTLQTDVRIAYLDVQTIHPYLAGELARHTGMGFKIALNAHRIEASILLPAEQRNGTPPELDTEVDPELE